MKDLFSKLILLVAGVAAFLGISAANAPASVPTPVSEITSKSALYLEHGKQINNDMGSESWHSSHRSHSSHESHSSHRSHSSGW